MQCCTLNTAGAVVADMPHLPYVKICAQMWLISMHLLVRWSCCMLWAARAWHYSSMHCLHVSLQHYVQRCSCRGDTLKLSTPDATWVPATSCLSAASGWLIACSNCKVASAAPSSVCKHAHQAFLPVENAGQCCSAVQLAAKRDAVPTHMGHRLHERFAPACELCGPQHARQTLYVPSERGECCVWLLCPTCEICRRLAAQLVGSSSDCLLTLKLCAFLLSMGACNILLSVTCMSVQPPQLSHFCHLCLLVATVCKALFLYKTPQLAFPEVSNQGWQRSASSSHLPLPFFPEACDHVVTQNLLICRDLSSHQNTQDCQLIRRPYFWRPGCAPLGVYPAVMIWGSTLQSTGICFTLQWQ